MHSQSNFKVVLLLIAFASLNFYTVFAQVDSIQFFRKKISEISKSPEFSEIQPVYIDYLNNLSYYLRYTGQDSMSILSEKALHLSKLTGYKQGELEALSNYSVLNLFNGNTDKAIEYSLLAMEDPKLEEYPKTEMKLYNQLGQAHFIKQNYPLTYSHFLHALSLAEKYNDTFYLFRMNMNLGTIFNLLEDYDEALLYYTNALESSKKLHNPETDAMLSSNLAYLNIQIGNLKKAKIYLDESINILENQTNKAWLAFSYTTIGQFHQKSNNYKDALESFEKSLNLHNSLNDIKGKADIFYHMSQAYIGLNNLPKAEEYVSQSLELYKSFNLDSGLENAYRGLYEIKKKQNDIEQSLAYLELTEKLSNDNFKKKNRRNLSMLNAKLNFEKEKENLQSQNELALSQQSKFIKWSLAALLTLLVVVFIILKANKREKSLNKKLASQAVILKDNQRELTKINSNQDRLFSIVGHDLRAPIISLKELLTLYLEDKEGKTYFEKFAPQLKDDLEQVKFTMDNLLHWGKTQMKGSKINLQSISVKHELEIILQFFRNDIEKKSISINTEFAENQHVFADLEQFNIIFRNLISNAIKFTPNNGIITISTKIHNAHLVIQVSDTGIGMSPTDMLKLFSETEHFSNYGTNAEKGTGLGLRLVKEMVIKNNGEIFVDSEPDKGSHFIVELPLHID
jgi:signal transduction histidine kinase